MVGCSGTGEESQLIRSYFLASRVDDRATLGNLAMVAFDPDTDGTVSTFSVESVTEDQRRALRLRELGEELAGIQAEEQEFRELKKVYQDEHMEAIGRVIEAERADESVGRRDQEVILQRYTTEQNDYGEEVETWSDIGSEWAAIFYGRGSERRQAAMERGAQPATFQMLSNPVTRAPSGLRSMRQRTRHRGSTPDRSPSPSMANPIPPSISPSKCCPLSYLSPTLCMECTTTVPMRF